MTSSFFSTGQSLHVSALSQNKNKGRKGSCEVSHYLGCVWLMVHWGVEVSSVSGNTEISSMQFENVSRLVFKLLTSEYSPLSLLLAT